MAVDDEHPSQDELDDLEDLMKQAGWDSDTIQDYVQMAAMDRGVYDDLWGAARLPAMQERDRDDYWPYPDYRGTIQLAADPDGRPVGISRRQLNEHMLVVGRTGAGKTTFFYNVMDLLNGMDVPFLVFDFKNDYRDVAADLDLTVINWRDLKFNPLQPPPGVATGKWGEVVAETFAHATDLLIGSESYFLEKLRPSCGSGSRWQDSCTERNTRCGSSW